MKRISGALPVCLSVVAVCFGQAATPGSPEFFERQIRPVILERCQGCHNPKSKTAGLDLTSAAGFLRGGDSGAIIDKDKPAKSRILRYLGYQEKVKMPPTGKLKPEQLEDFIAWVTSGASWGASADAEGVADVQKAKKEFTKGQRAWWAFQPVKNVPPPAVQNEAWAKNPIDRFILSKLEAKGLTPSPGADKLTLLRRATFDLTGLPPAEKEMFDFLDDKSPAAFETVVDRLLASPRYGERWGRHWLDVARYADSTGADEDHRYTDAWKYRDYVIQAFNEDTPYNVFVKEQLAGDMIASTGGQEVNRRGMIATGFLAIGPRLIAEQDKKKMFYDFVDEQIDTTTRAFLGMTVACARCHDHKFDPILTKDYYSLASIFASTKSFAKLEGTVSQMYRPPLVPNAIYEKWVTAQKGIGAKKVEIEMIHQEQSSLRVAKLESQIAGYMVAAHGGEAPASLDAKMLANWKSYLKPHDDVRPHLNRWERVTPETLRDVAATYQTEFHESYVGWTKAFDRWKKAVEKARADGLPGPDKPNFDESKNRFFEEVYLKKEGPFALPADQRLATYPAGLQAKVQSLESELEALKKASPPEPELAIGVAEGTPVTQHVFIRGDVVNEGEEVARQFPVILAGESQTPVAQGSGRKELAEWLIDPKHPLTARVMVNRIWQGHFGEGIVRTPSNFGLLGEKPAHPELLDYLATRFVEDGWSVKKMHKRIMLSSVYQASSLTTKEQVEKDASNKLLSRFPRRRLNVEEIRDAMLAIDSSIDTAMGGSLQDGTGTDGENSAKRMSIDPATSKRRTVYIPLRRSNLPSLLNLFDFGDGTTTNEGRSRTNVAPQALFAMNSPFVHQRATMLAEQTREAELPDVVRDAFLKILNRPAKEPEVTTLLDYMKRVPGDTEFAARRSLYRILLGSNEFIYVD